jgi:two-component system response regulator PilR (NtrC family)
VKIDVRLIAPPTAISGKAVADGVLREDLFYRLNVIPVHLPPLRDRREDIPLLVAYFIKKLAREVGRRCAASRGGGGDPGAVPLAGQHPRAGERGGARDGAGPRRDARRRGAAHERAPARHRDELPVELPADGIDLEATLDRIERRYMQLALGSRGGVQTRAAELLRVSFRQFRYKLQKLQPKAPQRRDGGG